MFDDTDGCDTDGCENALGIERLEGVVRLL